jgi:drug/metabolite transporter (DMT)-like permease
MISLIGGIILLVVGIILFAISRALPHPSAATAAYWIGIALAILGVIFIAIALILGIPYGADPTWDIDVLTYPVLQHL